MLFSGCFGYYDITDFNVLLGVSVDDIENNKKLIVYEHITANATSTADEEKAEVNTHLSSTIGDSIYHAFRRASTYSEGRRIYYPSIRMVVIGEETARHGIEDVVDFFARDPKRRNTVHLVIASSKGYDIFSRKHSTVESTTSEVVEALTLTKLSGYGVHKEIYKFIKEMNSLSGTGILNVVKLVPTKGTELMMEPKEAIQNTPYEVSLTGTAVLYNYKLIGRLDLNESLAVNIVRGDVKECVYVINKEKERDTGITVRLKGPKAKLIPVQTPKGYEMNIQIRSKAEIVEYDNEKPIKSLDFKDIGNKVSEEINKNILKTFEYSKNDLKVDILHLGDAFAIKYPKLSALTSDEWNKIFSEKVNIKLDTKVTITGTSSINEKVKR